MTRVAFIGLGNMGSGMAANQAKAGREVVAFDLSADAMARAKEQGMSGASSAAEAVKDANVVITITKSAEPVCRAAWLAGGTHVNAAGAKVMTRIVAAEFAAALKSK